MIINLSDAAERAHLNKKLVSFCAVALLFLGSLYYLVSVAFVNKGHAEARQEDIQDYIESI